LAAGVMGAVLAVAIGLNRLWERLYGPRVHVGFERFRPAWKQARLWWLDWLREQVGIFQYLDAPMPDWSYVAWAALLVGLLVAALWTGRGRDRVWLVLTLAGALFAPVFLYIAVIRHNGWTVQGRHVLPLTAVLPLLAGEVLSGRGVDSARARAWALLAVGGVAVLQPVAWWANAHRSAVGTLGPVWFWRAPEWSPPPGWWPWTVLVLAGAGLLLLSATSRAWRAPPPPSTAHR
ncbi:MAG TPA: DUF2142 domain-containing protein, partial [Myxococcaceae bacterium]|nr:DUF2142 domain-containing protein [Myxococcaceae bacterium]